MSFERIEHQIKSTLLPLKQGSMWYVPDFLFDEALKSAYQQGQVDGPIKRLSEPTHQELLQQMSPLQAAALHAASDRRLR